MIRIGDMAPDFTALAHDGGTVALRDLRGRHVVLWFFPKADTPGWTAEGRGFRDLKPAFDAKGAVILGVSFDTVEENRRFAEKNDFNFRLLCDTDRSIGLAYGATEPGETGNAKRVGVLVGPDGRIEDWQPKVVAKDYPAQVLERI